jgi:predicted MFS family arabinose efflux permease
LDTSRSSVSQTPGTTPVAGLSQADAMLLSARWYRNYVLAILFLTYLMNVIHRTPVLALALESIRAEFGVSDRLLGLLSGTTFSFFYAFMGIPIAAWADRTSRRKVLVLAVTLWSSATALFGVATSFIWLLLARVGVATGQAGNSPPAHSLISDYFPKSERARAFSIFAMAVATGTAIANPIGGRLVDAFGWRMAFVAIAMPGLLVALVAWLTIKEPPRGFVDGAPAAAARSQAPSMWVALATLWQRRSFRHLSLAVALLSVAWYARSSFNAAFFLRSHELTPTEAGNWLFLINIVGAAGTFAGGFLADRLSTRYDDRRWYLWVPGTAIFCSALVQLGGYLSPDLHVSILLLSLTMFLAGTFFGPAFAMTQALAPLRMRSVATSVLLFVQTIIGFSVGPPLAGQISDWLRPTYGEHSLAFGIAIVGLAGLWSAVHYYLGSRHLRQELAEVEAARQQAARDGQTH